MSQPQHTKPLDTKPAHLLNRRSFFLNSGAAILTTAFLSSCNDLIDDIFKKDKEPERDKTLAFFGDSLTIGIGGTAPYGSIVAAAMQDRPAFSDGIVGQPASCIAVRQGGTPLKITIEGGKLNGIVPVKITKLNNSFLSTLSNNFEYGRTGHIGGVRCTIKRSGSVGGDEKYTITPDTVSVADVPDNSEFILEDADRLKTATQILWYGRNNIGKSGALQEITAALETSIAHITAPARYIVVGVLTAVDEGEGTEKYIQTMAINDKLATEYGEQFVEMTPPTSEEMEMINYVPSAEDVLDLEKKNFPRGMRANAITDGIHLNDKGYKIVANRVVAKLKALKY